MSFLDDFFGDDVDVSTSKNTSNSVSSAGPEAWMRAAGKTNYNSAARSLPSSFKRYTGTRVAGYGSGYGTGKSVLDSMMKRSTSNYGDTRGRLDDLWGSQEGALTKTAADYMNPYTGAVLDPQLRAIGDARRTQINEDNRAATMAGAFGDPQAGIAKAVSNNKYNQLTADTTNRVYSDAYNAGRAEHESALARLMALPGMYQALDSNKFNEDATLSKAYTSFGLADQALNQKKLDVRYDDWMKSKGWGVNRAQTLMQLLGAVPHNNSSVSTSTGTGTSTTPGTNEGLALAGKIGGTALGSFMGGAGGEKLGDWLFS